MSTTTRRLKKPRRSDAANAVRNVKWTPFQAIPVPEELVKLFVDRGEAPPKMLHRNSVYQVAVYEHPLLTHLSIARHDQRSVRSWEELQQVKNEVLGEEYEAVELFPAVSRAEPLGGNAHLWVLPLGAMWPLGFGKTAAVLEAEAEAAQADEQLDEEPAPEKEEEEEE